MPANASLPVPTSNAAGAAVDVSTMGATKTVIIGGVFNATVTIEYSTAPAGNLWAPLQSFQGPGRVVAGIAVQRMRAVTSAYVSGAPVANVAAAVSPTAFSALTGVAVDILAFPELKTAIVDRACNVEVSDDGTVFNQVFSFQNPGAQSAPFTAQFARVTNGATCWLGGADLSGEVADNGILLQAAGVFQPDSGAGVVNVISSSGQFVSPGNYVGVGIYDMDMVPLPGITSALQVVPQVSGASSAGVIATWSVSFSGGHAIIGVLTFDAAGVPVDSVFSLHVDFLV